MQTRLRRPYIQKQMFTDEELQAMQNEKQAKYGAEVAAKLKEAADAAAAEAKPQNQVTSTKDVVVP
jgi:hypothetical protein